MNKLGIKLGLAATTTLSLLAFSTGAQAAGLSLRGDLLSTFSSTYVQTEGLAFDELALPQLDTSDLYWDGASEVEVFFLDEGAGFQNQLLYSANDQPLNMIFENVSSQNSTMSNDDGPLVLGEGRTLAPFTEATQLSFFINSDGNRRSDSNLFGADEYTGTMFDGREVNTDGLSHLVAYNHFDEVEQENYTIIGFEDLWGEHGTRNSNMNGYDYKVDRDFNDVVFAVKGLSIGEPEAPTEVPEPSLLLGMLGVAALGAKGAKRKLAV